MESRVVQIGVRFVSSFYEKLSAEPEKLFEFFHENSSLTIGSNSGVLAETVSSLKEIDKKIQSQHFKESGVVLSTVDCQESVNGGIFILVTGLFTELGQTRKFVQSFLLVLHDQSHYNLQNSVLRFLEIVKTPSPVEQAPSSGVATPTPQEPQTQSVENGTKEPPKTQKDVVEPQQSQQPLPEPVNATPQETPSPSPSPAKPMAWGRPQTNSQVNAHSPPQKIERPPKRQETSERENVLYVSRLPPSTTESKVKEIFSKMGEITRVTLKLEKAYCLIDFKDAASVKNVIEQHEKSPFSISGNQLSISKKQRTGGYYQSKDGSGGYNNRKRQH